MSTLQRLAISDATANVIAQQRELNELREQVRKAELSCTRFRRHRVRCFMEQEVCHGEKAVYAGVQA